MSSTLSPLGVELLHLARSNSRAVQIHVKDVPDRSAFDEKITVCFFSSVLGRKHSVPGVKTIDTAEPIEFAVAAAANQAEATTQR